jgi:hypothetical protein
MLGQTRCMIGLHSFPGNFTHFWSPCSKLSRSRSTAHALSIQALKFAIGLPSQASVRTGQRNAVLSLHYHNHQYDEVSNFRVPPLSHGAISSPAAAVQALSSPNDCGVSVCTKSG